ncbi:MAG: hypothetical protein RLY31_1311 [Bacteroidota bacterium]|jgi:myosin heavy subunit
MSSSDQELFDNEKTAGRNRSRWPLIWLPALLLVAMAGWFAYKSSNTTRILEQKVAELEESEQLRMDLQREYNEALAELESLRSEYADANQLIDQYKGELEQQRNQISNLLRNKSRLEEAREEIKQLKSTITGYLTEIEQLRQEQEALATANAALRSDNDSLQAALQRQTAENQALIDNRQLLLQEREELSKAVAIGSVIQVKDIAVTGLQLKKSGKAAEKSSARRVNQLKVCFTTLPNEVVKAGTEQFFIRIVNPRGETLAIEDLGTSTLVNRKTGEKVSYTQVKEYDYANKEARLCFVWAPSLTFQPGSYDVEIYNKGYLAGTGAFELK